MEPQTDSSTPIIGRPDSQDTDFACFVKAKDKQEKTFTLRSQDRSAPMVVRVWADENAKVLGEHHPKIVQARIIADQMEACPYRRQAD